MVASYHTMTRREYRDRVGSIGIGYGTDSFRHTYPPGHLRIGDSLTIWNGKQGIPYSLLEFRTGKQQRHVKGLPPAGKVFIKPDNGMVYDRRASFHKPGLQQVSQPTINRIALSSRLPVAEAKIIAV